MHTVSMTLDAKYDTACTLHNLRIIRAALATFKGNTYIKKRFLQIVLSHDYGTTICKFKGATLSQNFSCMRCYCHCMHDCCVQKSIISRRIWSRIQKGLSPWIRAPGVLLDEKKTEGRKSRDTVPLKMIHLRNFEYRNAGLSGIKTVRYRTEKN
jgi:hypothetical protein